MHYLEGTSLGSVLSIFNFISVMSLDGMFYFVSVLIGEITDNPTMIVRSAHSLK